MKIDAFQINTDWHLANSQSFKDSMRNLLENCNEELSQVVYSYIFKQSVYYLRDFPEQSIAWSPLIQTDKIQLNTKTNTQISANLLDDLETAVAPVEVDVIYPDYSNVDVGTGIDWPERVFSPYVDATAWPPYMFAELFPTINVPYFNLGFIVSQSPTVCKPTWGTFYSAENGPLNSQIKQIRRLGGDVNISFGGAANVPLHITAPSVDVLYMQYKLFADAYGLTRMDFDIEGTWISSAYSQQNINNAQALKRLQDDYASQGKTLQVWFTLPVLPTGLTGDGLQIISYARDAGVTITGVNIMAMDYGDSAAPNPEGRMGDLAIQAMMSTQSQVGGGFGNIGVTPMIGVNDVQSEVFTVDNATQVLQYCEMVGAGQISMWSSNRDLAGGSGIPQNDYEFTNTFNPYNSN